MVDRKNHYNKRRSYSMDIRLIVMIILLIVTVASTALLAYSVWNTKNKWVSKSENIKRTRKKY